MLVRRPCLVLALLLGLGVLAARAQDADDPALKEPPPTPTKDAADGKKPASDPDAKGGSDGKAGDEAKGEGGATEQPAAPPKPLAVGEGLPTELTLVPFPLTPPEPVPAAAPETPPAPVDAAVLAELVGAGEGPFVLLFWSGRCPVARRYTAVYRALVEDLGNARFAVVCPNAGENQDETRKALAAAHLAVPTFLDPEQKTSDRLRVAVTPTVLLFDAGGTLRYRGPLDDDRRAKDTERVEYLRAAIEALLAGKKVENPEPRAFGSSLRR